jgi:transposase
MADLAYRGVYTMIRIEARLRLVTTYHEITSIREAARRRCTSRQVIREWLRR